MKQLHGRLTRIEGFINRPLQINGWIIDPSHMIGKGARNPITAFMNVESIVDVSAAKKRTKKRTKKAK